MKSTKSFFSYRSFLKVLTLYFSLGTALFLQSSVFNPTLKHILPFDLISFIILFHQIYEPIGWKIFASILGILYLEHESLYPIFFHLLLYLSSLGFILWLSPKILQFSLRSLFLVSGFFFILKSWLIVIMMTHLIHRYDMMKHTAFLPAFLFVNTFFCPVVLFFLRWIQLSWNYLCERSWQEEIREHEIQTTRIKS